MFRMHIPPVRTRNRVGYMNGPTVIDVQQRCTLTGDMVTQRLVRSQVKIRCSNERVNFDLSFVHSRESPPSEVQVEIVPVFKIPAG